jgi:hypothetical protein
MQKTSVSLIEWLIPLAFIFCAGWAIWHMPAYFLTWFPHENESMFGQVSAIFDRNDVTPNLAPVLGKMDIVDLVTLLLVPVLFVVGAMTVQAGPTWNSNTGATWTARPCSSGGSP